MVLFHFVAYISSFFVIWFGAGLIIRATETFSQRLRISSFATSFIILGILTSIPEFSVGLNAIAENNPEIFVGNLLGGVIVIFLLIIPLLAVFGNGIRLTKQLESKNIFLIMMVIAAPSFFMADKKLTTLEGVFMILLYLLLLYFIEKRQGFIEGIHQNFMHHKVDTGKNIAKIIVGIIIVFISSDVIVQQTIYFSNLLGLSLFYISLLFLAIGTNLPELSLALRSVMDGKKDIAFGNYLGSASANSMVFGILSILYPSDIVIKGNFLVTFIFIILGISAFFYFSRSRNDISRREGFLLMVIYASFLIVQIVS